MGLVPKVTMLQVAGTELAKDDQDQAKKILFTYPMVKETDMNEDMRSEVLDICVNASVSYGSISKGPLCQRCKHLNHDQ
eukprot:TCALIF_04474-PA protein Name:"Protein of unknown function" AED:0.47 eAED:0.48 QI:0/0/0/1/1/1/3/0/78